MSYENLACLIVPHDLISRATGFAHRGFGSCIRLDLAAEAEVSEIIFTDWCFKVERPELGGFASLSEITVDTKSGSLLQKCDAARHFQGCQLDCFLPWTDFLLHIVMTIYMERPLIHPDSPWM